MRTITFLGSDSHAQGFGFSLHVVRAGDNLVIYGPDKAEFIGEVKVKRVLHPQIELFSKVSSYVLTFL